jgi:hypothetical protein
MTLREHRAILLAARDRARAAKQSTHELDRLIQDATTRLLRQSLRKRQEKAA